MTPESARLLASLHGRPSLSVEELPDGRCRTVAMMPDQAIHQTMKMTAEHDRPFDEVVAGLAPMVEAEWPNRKTYQLTPKEGGGEWIGRQVHWISDDPIRVNVDVKEADR